MPDLTARYELRRRDPHAVGRFNFTAGASFNALCHVPYAEMQRDGGKGPGPRQFGYMFEQVVQLDRLGHASVRAYGRAFRFAGVRGRDDCQAGKKVVRRLNDSTGNSFSTGRRQIDN